MQEEIKCTLREFLLLGRLGFVQIGMTCDDVLKHLGKPTGFYRDGTRTSYQKSHRWFYGSMEIIRDMPSNTVNIIRLNPISTKGLPLPLRPAGFFPEANTTDEEFDIYMNLENIHSTITRKWHPIGLESQVVFYKHVLPNVFVRFSTRKDVSSFTWMVCVNPGLLEPAVRKTQSTQP